MRPSAARNEVNFCAEMLSAPLPDFEVLEAPAAPLDVGDDGEPPLGAVLEVATPLAVARKASYVFSAEGLMAKTIPPLQ